MQSNYALPLTIVIAGALIAGAVFLTGRNSLPSANTGDPVSVRAYTPGTDHILGNPNAQVKVVEYADLECPYCKEFHSTMHQIMDHYGAQGQVAWVFRPFPLASIHSKAPKEAEAAECAAAQGGDTVFFKFVDKIYEVTPGSNGLDLAKLPELAGQVGLNVETFNQCLNSGTFSKKIADSYAEAVAAGGTGTPFTILMVGNDSVVLNGAQPYDSMRAAIDAVLGQMPGGISTTTEL